MHTFSRTTSGTRRLRHLWRTLFVCFLLLCFGCAQADTLRLAATAWLPAAAHWPPLVLALPPTALLVALHLYVESRAPFPPSRYVLTFAPSVAIAASLPAAATAPGWSLPVTALLLGLWFHSWHRHSHRRSRPAPPAGLLAQTQTNAIIFFAMLLYAGAAGQHSSTFHHELQAWQAIEDGDYTRALHIGRHDCRVSRDQFALRAYAAAHLPGGIGARLFAAALPDSASARCLLPATSRPAADSLRGSLARELGALPTSDGQAAAYFRHNATTGAPAADYHLAACLLDKQIDRFAGDYLRLRPHPSASQPPLYYAEALLLYSRLRTAPVLVYTDPACQANYHDFMSLRATRNHESAALRASRLRLTYGDTYWWYYYCR